MSIVAAMIFPNSGVIMYGDKRAVTNFGSRSVISDNYVKVHKLSHFMICGITGHGEWGLSLVTELKKSNLTNATGTIKAIQEFADHFQPHTDSTITLGGIYNDGRPFLWTYRTEDGSVSFEQEAIGYSIATHPKDLGNSCQKFLIKTFAETKNPRTTLQKVIEYAAIQNPTYISAEFDVEFIQFKL
jgi:hypothetical protein